MANRYRLIFFLAILAGSLTAPANPALGLTIEDFEVYATTGEMLAAWVPSAKGMETLEEAAIFEGQKAMKIEYDCGQGDFSTVRVYGTEQNWASFSTFSLMYVGGSSNSSEQLVVELRDPWGGFLKGSAVSNATQATVWTEYSMDISGWPNREWVKEVKIWVQADSWGQGTVYFDYLLLPSAIAVDGDTWSRIKSMYANKK